MNSKQDDRSDDCCGYPPHDYMFSSGEMERLGSLVESRKPSPRDVAEPRLVKDEENASFFRAKLRKRNLCGWPRRFKDLRVRGEVRTWGYCHGHEMRPLVVFNRVIHQPV